MGMLTVRENIAFSAALRLPSSTTQSQRRDKVSEVIADLGLSACAHTTVRLRLSTGCVSNHLHQCADLSLLMQLLWLSITAYCYDVIDFCQ